MQTMTIPKKITRGEELIVITRKEYEGFLNSQKLLQKKLEEEEDTNLAIKIYEKEKHQRKLKPIGSLAQLR